MSTVSISICDADRNVLQRAYARGMSTALRDAIADAKALSSAQRPDLFLRDALGGLRAEVRHRDGDVTVVYA